MRRWIAALTVVATFSAPLAAEASPWGWVKSAAHTVDHAANAVLDHSANTLTAWTALTPLMTGVAVLSLGGDTIAMGTILLIGGGIFGVGLVAIPAIVGGWLLYRHFFPPPPPPKMSAFDKCMEGTIDGPVDQPCIDIVYGIPRRGSNAKRRANTSGGAIRTGSSPATANAGMHH